MEIFQYGEKEIKYLKKKDKKLAAAIDRIGMLEREVNHDVFKALTRGIVAQQISSKAAITIWNRLNEKVGDITPKNIFETNIETIQKCGVSMRKATYIWGISKAVIEGVLDISNLLDLSDEEIVKKLTSQSGIGIWTAEMILIFSLERPNVLSEGDLAIRRGLIKLYGHKEIDKEKFELYKKRYSPYCSVASLYLWHIAGENL